MAVGWQTWGGIACFLLYSVLAAGLFWIGIPLYWTAVVCKRPLSCLGITTRWLWPSLVLQIVFAVMQYAGTLAHGGLPGFERLLTPPAPNRKYPNPALKFSVRNLLSPIFNQ